MQLLEKYPFSSSSASSAAIFTCYIVLLCLQHKQKYYIQRQSFTEVRFWSDGGIRMRRKWGDFQPVRGMLVPCVAPLFSRFFGQTIDGCTSSVFSCMQSCCTKIPCIFTILDTGPDEEPSMSGWPCWSEFILIFSYKRIVLEVVCIMLLLYNNLQSYALELKRHMETTEHTSRTRRRECFALERERERLRFLFFFRGWKTTTLFKQTIWAL